MATTIQTPDSLSLLMNLKSFIVSSTTDISFAMSCSGETIVEESYTPDGNGRIEIQVRDLVARFLETGLPSSNQYVQTSAVRTFSASVNGNAVSTFTVVNGGVRKLSVTPELFLKANWLTWQPQTKRVGWSSPEYLSYYFVDAGTVKAKFYYKAGGTKVVTVASGTAGQLQTFNMAMSRLFSVGDVSEDDVYGLVDVWVETGAGVQLSYVQRYVFAETQGDEHVYLAVNALGGIDTFTFHGERKVAPDVEHESAELGDTKIDITAGAVRHWEQNTGHLGTEESSWIYELISSKRAWAVLDGQAEAIVIDADSNEYSDLETLSAGTFSYYLSEEGGLQSIGRETGQLPVIEVPSPAGEIFFLEARLIDYPDADLSENLLLLAQSPFSRAWYRLDLGSTLDWIYSSVVTSPIGQMAHEHENLLTLGQLSESSGRLTYRGEALARLSDIPNIPAPTPAEHWFDPVMDDEDEQVVGMKALFDMYIVQTAADEEEGTDEEQKNISEILRHLRLETVGEVQYLATDISFYSDQAVSAGGISEGGGGGTGGGITADGMWALLAASTHEQIDASHLSQALGGYATQAWVLAQGFGTITKESIIEALEYTPVAPDDLLPFASGLASVASRLDDLEQWFDPVMDDEDEQVVGMKALFDMYIVQTAADEEEGTDEEQKNISEILRHLRLETVGEVQYLATDISFYSDQAVSAGGISEGGGGGTGGGITADGMWALLAASTHEQIDASHLSQALGGYATQAWVLAQGLGTITKESIIEVLEYTPVAPDDLLPFASGLASAASRLDALEYWLTRPVLEDLALTSLHVDRTIDLGGLVLEYDYTNDAWHLNGNFYADGFVSAGGMSSTGSGTGGGIDANAMWTILGDGTQEQIHSSHLADALSDYALKTWVAAQGYLVQSQMWALLDAPSGERIDASHLALSLGTGGNYISNVSLATNETTGKKILTFSRGTLPTYVSRVAMSVPTGFSVSGSPITSSGTLALSFSNGYSLPTTAKQSNWDTAYGWGDHAQAGYAKADSLMAVATATAGATARLRALEYWLTRPVLEDLKLTSLHVERTIDLGGLTLEYDYAVSAWHLKGNIYADGFVSAGGYSGSSSEGGINTTAMWQLLAAATSEQISASHLSTALNGYATQEWVRAQGYSLTAEAIAIALNYVPVAPDDLVTLAAADATAAARISAIEYWLTRPVLEDLALTALHVDRTIDLGGLVLEYDYTNNAWHLKGNIYADGFVSAGGMSATASGGGISATAMWNLLDDATTEQINASHLSTALATYATQAWVQALGYTTATNMWQLLAAATSEQIAASHLPISVSQGSGSYVTGISYSGGTFSVSRANISIPTLLPNPYALSFGSKSYDGSAARTITAADLGAITGNQAITLAGDVMGSGTTYITTTIGTGVVTNAMLAGSIANGKLANSSISLAGRSVSLGGSITASAMRSDLSISNVENTALSSWAGTTNITKVGTITTGTWHGSAIANSYLANSSITLAGRSISLGGSITAANMLSDLGLSGVVGDISTLQGYFTSGKANYAVADGDGNTISSTYLKLSGGTMTGDLHMGSSYGRRIYFGDGSYCYIGELSDDVMSIYGDKGINILTASSSRAVSVGSSSVATPLYVYGRLYLTASAYLEYSSSAIHATAGFYSDSFISAGGISTSSDARLKEDIEGISATKAWTVLAGLRPVTFRWKVDHRRAAGYIAQEVERVLPEAVTETGGIKRLQYDILFTYGMAALGGLRLQQETQEQKIARLERRVEYLERRIGLAV